MSLLHKLDTYWQKPLLYWPLLLLLAAATPLTFAPYYHFWLMPLLFAALIRLWELRPRRAVAAAYLFGLAAYTAQFYWIHTALHDVSGLPNLYAVPLDEDIRRIEAVLEVVGDGQRLAVDANGRFDLQTGIAYAEAIKKYNLFWYEEVGDPLDYALQAELANHYELPMATGENLFSHQDARNLLRHGGMRPDRDYLQFDCALSYGLVEYMRTLKVMEELGWSSRRVVPHGGHQMSLNIAAGLHLGGNESYPDVFQPFGGFADGIRVENGYVGLPDIPGVGFEAKSALYAVMRELGEG